MPNPDGTRTRDEHRAAIVYLYLKYEEAGMSKEEAMIAAGKEWHDILRREGDEKIAQVTAWLNGSR